MAVVIIVKLWRATLKITSNESFAILGHYIYQLLVLQIAEAT